MHAPPCMRPRRERERVPAWRRSKRRKRICAFYLLHGVLQVRAAPPRVDVHVEQPRVRFLRASPAPPAQAGCPARQLVQEVAWLAPNMYMLNVRCGWFDRFTGYCMAVRWSCLNMVHTRALSVFPIHLTMMMHPSRL